VRGPWAQEERNPWVRVSLASQDLKGVIVVKPLCAELLRFSRVFLDKDWIDEGSLPVYYLCYGHVAQSGVNPSGHPIVGEERE